MATSRKKLTLPRVIELLREQHGPPTPPPTSDPFELVLWENVAYLASPAKRREAFDRLRRTIGTAPAAILAAKKATLERVTSKGILEAAFADKLRECARIAVEEHGGDLGAVVRGPLAKAKKALRLYPGIGEPGAEKILLFSGQHALLAPDSNALRVLARVGLIHDDGSYARTYAASREVASQLGADPVVVREAHLLLQRHGQTSCKRAAPRCDGCSLAPVCAHALTASAT